MFRNRSLPMYFAPDDEQGGGFSVEEAVAKLGEQRAAVEKSADKPEKQEAPRKEAAPVEQDEPEAAPEAGDTEEVESTAEKSSEEMIAAEIEREKTPDPNLKLPQGWRGEADEKAFTSLTPEAQEIILRREREREVGLNKQLETAAIEKKAAAAERDALKAERQRLAPLLNSTTNALIAKMVEEFPGVDPRNPASVTQFALEHPDRYPAYDALWKQIGAVAHQQKQVEAEQKQREEAEYNSFAETRVSRLLELDETLKDPAKSAAFEKGVVEYLMTGNGYGKIDAERIKHYTAEELLMARKARLYDKAMAALKKSPPAKTPGVARPGAGVEGGKTEKESALEKRLKKTGSVEDAVELMRLKRAG
jgi:hypothetical protein